MIELFSVNFVTLGFTLIVIILIMITINSLKALTAVPNSRILAVPWQYLKKF